MAVHHGDRDRARLASALALVAGVLPAMACRSSEPLTLSTPLKLEVQPLPDRGFRALWEGRTVEEWVANLRSGDRRCSEVDLVELARIGQGSAVLRRYLEEVVDERSDRSAVLAAIHALARYYPCGVSLPRLVRTLDHPDGFVRSRASLLLAECGADAQRIVALLVEQLDDEGQGTAPIEALAALGTPARPAVPRLLEMLPGSKEHIRRALLMALARIDPNDTAPIEYLVDVIASGDCYVWASDALVRYGQPAVDAVLPLLDQEGRPRFCALHVLAKLCPRAEVPLEPLIRLLDDALVDNRDRARRLIACLGDAAEPVVDRWVRDLASRDPSTAQDARWALIGIGEVAVPKLLPLLESTERSLRREVVRILAEADPTDAVVSALKGLLMEGPKSAAGDDDLLVRLEATSALALFEVPVEVGPVLREALASEDETTRRRAAKAVRELGGRVANLTPLPEAISLQESRGIAALPAHLEALRRSWKESPEQRRVAVIEAIAALGPAAKDALPVLKELLAQDEIRAEVALAIVAIDPGERESIAAVLREHLVRTHAFDVQPDRQWRSPYPPRNERRVKAARALWKIGGNAREVLPALIEEIRPRPRASSRIDVLDLIGEIGPAARFALPWVRDAAREYAISSGLSTLERVSGDQANFHGRLAATRALARISEDPGILREFLLRHLEEGEVEDIDGGYRDTVREGCVRDLTDLGESIVPVLIELARRPDPVLRLYAIRALGRSVGHELQVLPVLRRAVEDPHATIRKEARKGLRAISAGR